MPVVKRIRDILGRTLPLSTHASLHAKRGPLLLGLHVSRSTGGSRHLRGYHLSLGLQFDIQRLQSLVPLPTHYSLPRGLAMLVSCQRSSEDADSHIALFVALAL